MASFFGKQTAYTATASAAVLLFFFSGCTAAPLGDDVAHPTSSTTAVVAQETDDEIFVSINETFDLPIFGFHHVGPAPAAASADARTWYISEKTFESMLKYLTENEYTPLFASEAVAYIKAGKLPEKSVILTFDDGAADVYTHAWPLLKQYGVKATVNIMTGVRGENWLSAEQIKEMHADGSIEFQSHTRYHAYLTRVSETEAREELATSKAYLEELIGDPVTVIAYPFGLYSDRIIAIAKELGYRAGITIHSGKEQERDNLFELRRFLVTEYSNIERILSE